MFVHDKSNVRMNDGSLMIKNIIVRRTSIRIEYRDDDGNYLYDERERETPGTSHDSKTYKLGKLIRTGEA